MYILNITRAIKKTSANEIRDLSLKTIRNNYYRTSKNIT